MRRSERNRSGETEPGLAGSMTEATKRIQEIIDDADRQAGQILVKAEVEARRYVAEVKERTDREAVEYARSMSALGEALISQAELLHRESERLLAGLREQGLLDYSTGNLTQPDLSGDRTGIGSDDEFRFNGQTGPIELLDTGDQSTNGYSAGARLLATQMAVAGSTRSDIQDRLVNDFGIANPEPLLDSILGPG